MKIFIFLCLKLSVLLSLCVLPNCQAKETIPTTLSTTTTSSSGSTSITNGIDNGKVTGSTGAISNAEPTELKLVSIKPKRDAALSLGGGYHGPSHKYLPPTTLTSIQYQYQPQHHHHGNALSSTSGFDFGNLDESNYHQHHHQHHHDDHHHYQDQHHYAQAYLTPVYQPNKFATYIVQSEHGSSNGVHGYKYVAPALGHHHHHVTEKPHKSYILSSVDQYQPQPQISYDTYVHNKPISSHAHGHSVHGHSTHGSSSNNGYHYAPVVEHVEHDHHDHEHHHHQSQQHVVPATNSLGPYLSGTIHGHAGQGGINAGIGFSASLGGNGYQYDIPHSSSYQTIARKPQVLTSYGLPIAVAAAGDEPRHQHHHTITAGTATTQHQHQHEHNINNDDDIGTPAYAVGHKGLGHFSYVSSKPHATLHNDISEVSVAPHQALIGEQQHYDTHTLAEISKAPFKPSAFLGAKHEITSGGGGGDISIYESSVAAQQYLPPTSHGYEYQPPTVLYGAPTHSGDSAAPIYEPVEATYLPPSATSAAAGAVATTSGNYLPPTQH